MRLSTLRCIHDARKILNQNSSSSLDSETMNEVLDTNDVVLIGIENMLTPNIIKQMKATREQHMRAISTEQEAQACVGVFDADRLATVSRYYSKSVARRAHSIALFQSR